MDRPPLQALAGLPRRSPGWVSRNSGGWLWYVVKVPACNCWFKHTPLLEDSFGIWIVLDMSGLYTFGLFWTVSLWANSCNCTGDQYKNHRLRWLNYSEFIFWLHTWLSSIGRHCPMTRRCTEKPCPAKAHHMSFQQGSGFSSGALKLPVHCATWHHSI